MRLCFRFLDVNAGIVAALVAAAKDARKVERISAEEMAVALKRSGPGSKSKVSRFEKMEHYKEIDRVLNTYAEESGLSLIDLLRAAERKLPKSAHQRPHPKVGAARRATRVARGVRKETGQAPDQSAGKQPSKAKKTQDQ